MGIFANDVVTVFNRHIDTIAETETWIGTVISGVNLVATKGANITTSGLSDADSAKLFIDFSAVSDKYVEPKAYSLLTLENKRSHMTFRPQNDFFVKGDISSVTVLEEGFFEWMVKHYDDVYRITTVDRYEDVMPHFEIGGK